MNADQYLYGLLQKYAIQAGANSPLVALANTTIYPVLVRWAGIYLREVRFAGSCAKGTANTCSSDMDLFISLKSTTPHSLKEIFENLFDYASAENWIPRKQDVSIGIFVGGCNVDLVPGKLQSTYLNWHSLYRRANDSWTQTNIEKHIAVISGSGRVNEIRLVKLWRTLSHLDFPSFFLEMAVIEALKYHRQGQLANNFSYVLEWLHANVQTVKLIDPANTNNIVSDDLTNMQKKIIADAAWFARTRPYYSDFVW